MNILIAGGAGYIGSHICTELIAAGYEPIVVDNLTNSRPFIYDRIAKIVGRSIIHYNHDVRDVDFMTSILKKHNCKAVIYLAAYKSVVESVGDPLKYYDNNICGLVAMLQAMNAANVRQFIYSSSTTVYGNTNKLPMTEDSPVQPPMNPYGATKQMSEQIIKDVCSATKMRALILRYFNPIGAHPTGLIGELPIGVPSFLLPYVMQVATGAREDLTVYGDDYNTIDGSPVRDYIHIMDLARAHIKSLNYLGKVDKSVDTFNICTGSGTSVFQFIEAFEDATGVKIPHKVGPRRKGDIASSYASGDKAKKMLGWEAELSVKQALADTWRWQKSLDKSVY
ncbi:MAG: UDP-glucose 4-epimerase GalE [Candidatus Woesebacteria bacterium]|jgi:UDP-glucose 4-epimerase